MQYRKLNSTKIVILVSFLLAALYGCSEFGNLYSVYYSSNGFDPVDIPLDDRYYQPGDPLFIPDLEDPDSPYRLVRWNTEADGSGTDFFPGDLYSFASRDFFLFAICELIPVYSIHYESTYKGMNTVEIREGHLHVLSEPDVFFGERKGYEFLGWRVFEEGLETLYLPGESIEIAEDWNLSAVWEPLFMNISYDGNGAEEGILPENLPVQQWSPVTTSPHTLYREGYSFTGWNSLPDGSGIHYGSDREIMTEGEDMILYAEWTQDLLFNTVWTTTEAGESDRSSLLLPLVETGIYSFHINWGDGTSGTVTTWDSASTEHTYSIPGEYQVTINGEITGWSFADAGDAKKLLEIQSWGPLVFGVEGEQFRGCTHLRITAEDIPSFQQGAVLRYMFQDTSGIPANLSEWITSGVSDMKGLFYNVSLLNADLSNWDTSSVTDMSEMFAGASVFNSDLSGWDTSSVTDMSWMFFGARSFESELSEWDISRVTTLQGTFSEASVFNSNISGWDTSSVTDMSHLFEGAVSFNRDLYSWDVARVIDMSYLFYNAFSFNGDLSAWDTSSVKNMASLFQNAYFFNGDLSSWDVSSVTDMNHLFDGALVFNGDLSGWEVSRVIDMNHLLAGAQAFSGDLSAWDTSSVTNMAYLFDDTDDFSSDLSGWNTERVTDMSGMFSCTDSFNGDLSTWNTSAVTDMHEMFFSADLFSGDLSSWDVSQVTDMSKMFSWAESFNGDLSTWDVSQVTSMKYMFNYARSFDGDLSGWDTSSVTDMAWMFSGASSFSGDVLGWNTSSVYNMGHLFYHAGSINEDFSSWDISSVTDMSHVFSYTALDTENYSRILTTWATTEVQPDVVFHAQGIFYNADAADARRYLIEEKGWQIYDSGEYDSSINYSRISN